MIFCGFCFFLCSVIFVSFFFSFLALMLSRVQGFRSSELGQRGKKKDFFYRADKLKAEKSSKRS